MGQSVQVPLHLAAGTERTCSAVLSCRSGTTAHSHWERADALCVLTKQEKKQLLLGPGSMVPGTQLLGLLEGSGGRRRGGKSRADEALNHFTFFATQLGIKHTGFCLAESFFPNPAFL